MEEEENPNESDLGPYPFQPGSFPSNDVNQKKITRYFKPKVSIVTRKH
jgi:hypothetical protein